MRRRPLNRKQLEIMEILWEAKAGMTLSQIAKRCENLKLRTVHHCLKVLTRRRYVRIVNKAALSNKNKPEPIYVPVIDREEYLRIACEQLMALSSSDLLMISMVNEIDDEATLHDLGKQIRKRLQRLKED